MENYPICLLPPNIVTTVFQFKPRYGHYEQWITYLDSVSFWTKNGHQKSSSSVSWLCKNTILKKHGWLLCFSIYLWGGEGRGLHKIQNGTSWIKRWKMSLCYVSFQTENLWMKKNWILDIDNWWLKKGTWRYELNKRQKYCIHSPRRHISVNKELKVSSFQR